MGRDGVASADRPGGPKNIELSAVRHRTQNLEEGSHMGRDGVTRADRPGGTLKV